MNGLVLSVGRVLLTLLLIAGAIVALVMVWRHYEDEPWTRDGKVLADVVQVSADVAGLVTRVMVRDNQVVRNGDVLFEVDRERYTAQLAQMDAAVANMRATLANAVRERRRYQSLGDLVSQEVLDQRITAVQQSTAQLQQAIANRRVAEINLERSRVRARVNGFITGFTMRPGDYVDTGKAVFALLDSDSYYVVGYFEETKLHDVRIGDRAQVALLGDRRLILGSVQSLSAGIDDREQSASAALLPNITPTFSWIRLAQRVPVRIAIEQVPPGLLLIAGRTATVTLTRTAQTLAEPATTVEGSAAASQPPPILGGRGR